MPNDTATPQRDDAPDDSSIISLQINGKPYRHAGDAHLPLLWYLRDVLRLTGTRFGCGTGECGACTVLVDGKARRACQLSMEKLGGSEVTTIEGLEILPVNAEPDATAALHPLQQAWIDEDAIGCGYCQSGQIMAALDLLTRKPKPREADIAGINNLCRCGLYPRIRHAILRAADAMRESG